MKTKIWLLPIAILMGFLSFASNAAVMTFDSPIVSGTGPGEFTTDRYTPATFQTTDCSAISTAGNNCLELGVSAKDYQSNSFYNWQGEKTGGFDTNHVSVDMYMEPSYANNPNHIGGLWTMGVDSTGAISYYSAMDFLNNQFQVFDSLGGTGWVNVGTPTNFTLGSWVTLGVTLDTVNNLLLYTLDGHVVKWFGAGGTKMLTTAFLQGRNSGTDNTLYFDNLNTSNTCNIPTVPLPPAALLFAPALLGFIGLRRKSKLAAAA